MACDPKTDPIEQSPKNAVGLREKRLFVDSCSTTDLFSFLTAGFASRRNDSIQPDIAMTVEVALAMLQHEGRWLLQLRDENPRIVAPGCWGLFGGHLEPGETALIALRRELNEEIGWCPDQLTAWFRHQDEQRIVNVFTGTLSVPVQQLQLLEGQDMILASPAEIRSGRIWSRKLKQERPLASALSMLIEKLDEITQAD